MMTIFKVSSALISASFLLVTMPAAYAGNFSMSIGYSNFGHHHGYLPYAFKPFSHPKTIYYSPLRPYPNYYYHSHSPGYRANYNYYVPKPYHGYHKKNPGYKNYHHDNNGYKKYYYKNHYRGSYQKIPQKIDIHKK